MVGLTDPLLQILIIVAAGFLGGFVGAMTGLGGSAIATPILVSYLGIPLREAIGSGIVVTIANSSTSGASYLAKGMANLRIGYSLAAATMIGSTIGVLLNSILPVKALFIAFGIVLLVAPLPGIFGRGSSEFVREPGNPDRISTILGLEGSYYDESRGGLVRYRTSNFVPSFISMIGAGAIAGLLGIGAGAFKVLSMDYVMGLPFKVSTATSSFVIGLTATSGGSQYLVMGLVDPFLVAMLSPGVFLGSYISSRMLGRMRTRHLRIVFAAVVWILAFSMILRGV